MAIDFSLYDWKDEILNGDPRYTIQDDKGQVIEDNVQISLKTPAIQEGTSINKKNLQDLEDKLWKVGEVKIFGTTITKTNTLLCDGKSVYASDYPELKTAIGSQNGLKKEPSNNTTYSEGNVAFGEGRYVAHFNTTPYSYSSDCKNWTSGTKSGSMSLHSIVYNKSDGYFYAASLANNSASNYSYGGIYRSTDGTNFTTYQVWTGAYDANDVALCDDGDIWCVGEDGHMATGSGGAFEQSLGDLSFCGNAGDKYFYSIVSNNTVTSINYFTGKPTASSSRSSLTVSAMKYFRKVNGKLFGLGGSYLLEISSTPSVTTRVSGAGVVNDIVFANNNYYVLVGGNSIRRYNTSWTLLGTYSIPVDTDNSETARVLMTNDSDIFAFTSISGRVYALADLIYLPEFDVSKRQYAYIRTSI